MTENANIARLDSLKAEIKSLQSQYRDLISRGAAIARQLGTLLTESRSLIRPAHKWSQYCVKQLDMAPATAHRYITISRQWERVERHSAFPNLSVIQMFDVARGRPLRSRSYKLRDQSLDVLLDILDERLVAAVSDVPELESLMDAIDQARGIMESHGLLKSDVEARKRNVRTQRRMSAV